MVWTTTTDAREIYKVTPVMAASINYAALTNDDFSLVAQITLGRRHVKTEKIKRDVAKLAKRARKEATKAAAKEAKNKESKKNKTDEGDNDYVEMYTVNSKK